MRHFYLLALLLSTCLALCHDANAQGTRADYDRSDRLAQLTQGKVFYNHVNPHWSSDGNTFWYRDDGPGGERQFIWVDAIAGTRQQAFDREKLAATLGKQLQQNLDPRHLPIDSLEADAKGGCRIFHAAGKRWQVNLDTYEVTAIAGPANVAGIDSLPVLRHIHASRDGEETTITFVNRTSAPIKLFWISPDDTRVPYGSVAPGKTFEQNT